MAPLDMGLVAPDAEFIPMKMKGGGEGKMLIRSKTKPLEINSLPGGIFKIPVDEHYRKENPIVRVRPRSALEFTATAHFDGAKGAAKRYVKIDRMEATQSGNVTAFYDAKDKARALRFLKRSHTHAAMVRAVTGFEPDQWGIVTVSRFERNKTYVVSGHTHPFSVWLYEAEDFTDGGFDGTNTHEWIESTIGTELNLHNADSKGRNRILVDGLADYGQYVLNGVVDNIISLKRLQKMGVEELNLPEKFQSIRLKELSKFDFSKIMGDGHRAKQEVSAGYALSCLFWIQLCEKHGKDLPLRFCQEMKSRKKRDFESCLSVLERLTGEKDLFGRLSRMNVKESIRLLQGYTKKKQ